MESPTEQFSQTVIATRLGPDVSALADAYLERTKHENAWALMWFEYLCEHRLEKNGWKWIWKRWEQEKKERVKAQEKAAKARAKAEAKAAKEREKADKAQATKAKAKAPPKAKKATSTEQLPSPTISMEELDQLTQKVTQETVSYLTCCLEDELGDLYSRYSEMVEALPPFFPNL